MTLPDGASGQILDNLFEIYAESGLYRVQMGVQLGAHPFALRIGLGPDIGEHLSLFPAEDHRVGQSLAAEVGASRVVRVVDPESRRLILAVEGDELDVEHRVKMPCGAFIVPLPVAVHAVEVIDSHDADIFRRGHVESLSHVSEGAERVRSVQMSVNVDYLFHIHEFSFLKVNNIPTKDVFCG